MDGEAGVFPLQESMHTHIGILPFGQDQSLIGRVDVVVSNTYIDTANLVAQDLQVATAGLLTVTHAQLFFDVFFKAG